MKDRPFFMSAPNVDTNGRRIHERDSAISGRRMMRMMNWQFGFYEKDI